MKNIKMDRPFIRSITKFEENALVRAHHMQTSGFGMTNVEHHGNSFPEPAQEFRGDTSFPHARSICQQIG